MKDMGDKYVNQIPYESCVVNKKFLSKTVLELYGSPDWLPRSYDLSTEYEDFLGEFLFNKTHESNNFWIAKPPNLARSINMAISDNLDVLVRLGETGPYIVSKYVERPLKFRGSKFDFRFYVMVRSMEPLEVYVHDIFYVRKAKNDFTLDKRRLFQYDTHFTYTERDESNKYEYQVT